MLLTQVVYVSARLWRFARLVAVLPELPVLTLLAVCANCFAQSPWIAAASGANCADLVASISGASIFGSGLTATSSELDGHSWVAPESVLSTTAGQMLSDFRQLSLPREPRSCCLRNLRLRDLVAAQRGDCSNSVALVRKSSNARRSNSHQQHATLKISQPSGEKLPFSARERAE